MGEIRKIEPVLLIVAAFARNEEALAWAWDRLTERYGPVERESENFRVDDFTEYYAASMGRDLRKRFWAFRNLIDPSKLASIKRATNDQETEYTRLTAKMDGPKGERPDTDQVERSLNLDPGYIDLGKLILASTKDHAHRIYLRDGIFAETTLIYTRKRWQALPWTYPDYQSPDYQRFFDECRTFLKARRIEIAAQGGARK